MIIVVEGNDGTGKTSLGLALEAEHHVGYLKSNAPPTHNDEIDDWIVSRTIIAMGRPQRPVLLDRSIISAVCYSGRYDTVVDATRRAWAWFDYLMTHGHEVYLVHLTAQRERRLERDPHLIDSETASLWKIDEVAEVIGGLLPECHYVKIDTSEMPVEDVMECVVKETGLDRRW